MKTPAFADRDVKFRMAAREIVDSCGGMVSGYHGGCLQVALPSDRDSCVELTRGLEALGLEGEQRWTYFPLGSDNPPESLRHFGPGTAAAPRGDRPGYWKYRNFFVRG